MYKTFEMLLKEKGVKVADVCKATGLKPSMMSDWKRGKYTPKTDKLQLIADYFGVPLETFTGRNQPPRLVDMFAVPKFDEAALRKIFDNALEEALTDRYRLTDDEKKIILAYRIAPESTKDIIRKILDVGAAEGSDSLTEVG